jgi:hypothetical protein
VSDPAFDWRDWVGLTIVILAFGNTMAGLVHHFVLKYHADRAPQQYARTAGLRR